MNILDKKWTLEDFPMKEWELSCNIVYKGKWVHNWFSNFELTPIIIDGLQYPSVENYYQSQKTNDSITKQNIRLATPSKAKQIAKTIAIRDDWQQIKFDIMFRALTAKCRQDSYFHLRLKEWGEIVEWNNWGDYTWGVPISTKTGRNALGVQLMYIANNLKL